MDHTFRASKKTAWILLTPLLICLSVVGVWPLLRTFYFSFTDATLGNFEDAHWVGLFNYQEILRDWAWWTAVWNTLQFTGISVFLEMILGVSLALFLHQKFFGRDMVRTVLLIPWAMTTIVTAKLWAWMWNDAYGIMNQGLLSLGVISHKIAWLADPTWSLMVVIITDVWKTTPFITLLTLAALQMLPHEIYEAAKIDGVSKVKVFFKVTLPLIKPALVVAAIFRTLDALRVFDLIYVMTANSRESMSMSVYARQQLIDFQEVGYGSAVSSVIFMVLAVIAGLYWVSTRVSWETHG